ncbi:MAG TPA: Smr/MutS family protein [Stellaceae bacterium]|nr:Smr/MutS family protein [Stellaceae bacterium]
MRGEKPLARVKPPGISALPKPAAVARLAPPRPSAPLPKAAKPLEIGQSDGIDRASFEKLKRGQMAIEARLDLHGQTQDEAHRALSVFIVRAQAQGRRLALVITGKGREGRGVLRESVPRWLNEPALRGRVLALAAAQPRDGGSGALYVLLRRIQP